MIELRNVTKRFETVQAVGGISFTAEEGQIFGLLGPNGAGKSTTIRMIMNILAPDTGEILFSGRPIREEDKDRIGYLPEERGLYKKVKVGDMLAYFGALKGAEPARIRENIEYWLRKFDMTEWKDRKIMELSKGMGQKIQFIASIVHDPTYIFFDEPFSGLDPVSSDLLRQTIQELGERGKTILFSTHIMEQAEKICSKILLMNKGKEVISGTMESVKDRYGTRSVVIEFDGDGGFISGLPFVKHCITYPRYMEVELADDESPDRLLAALVNRISIRRFEIMSPSLHKIFIDLVRPGTAGGGETNGNDTTGGAE